MSVRKKMKDKAFARSENRHDIINGNGAADLGVQFWKSTLRSALKR